MTDPMNTNMIAVVVPGVSIARFAPQTFVPNATGSQFAFPLECDATLLQNPNATVTIVPANTTADVLRLSNVSIIVDHYGDGIHQIAGDLDGDGQ